MMPHPPHAPLSNPPRLTDSPETTRFLCTHALEHEGILTPGFLRVMDGCGASMLILTVQLVSAKCVFLAEGSLRWHFGILHSCKKLYTVIPKFGETFLFLV